MASILVVEDKESMRLMLKETLTSEGFDVVVAKDGEEGIEVAAKSRFDLMLIDLKLPKKDGLEVLRVVKSFDPFLVVILMTAYGTIETAVQAMKEGAYDFITKPFDTDHLIFLIRRALEERNLLTENILLREELARKFGLDQIIGKSQAIQKVIEMARKVALSNSTVLLLGESGTGKELFARAIHQMSPRQHAPFVAINCAAIPRELLENELFGSEKGAFTGATARKIGKFELANHGSAFLDEVGDLDLALQGKLLRVLQERNFERLGGTHTISVDLRIIAASNRDLKEATERKEFREDLYYRLSVFPISIPPLRERKEDIPDLVQHFLSHFCRDMKKEEIKISPEVMALFLSYSWPGNVRELENTIERAVILCDGDTIQKDHIWITPQGEETPINLPLVSTLKEAKAKGIQFAEAQLITRALAETKGNKSKAAKLLKVSYRVLLKKIREYGIKA